jgi:hypothetical protein
MSSRLLLKHGLVAERDRLSSSADSMLVTEPATGSKSRTKGNLYVLVSSAVVGGRARDAAAAAAQTVQREYYYDESAGIPILLEKCFRSANRKLRGRDGSGIGQGSIGIGVAVVRGNELYVATVGAVAAYLVRAARLLVPEHKPGPGIPANDVQVDVWRGDLAAGDTVLLVSHRLVEAVGTEELKNAVVTLHPQSAVEHLHHLFVASGGQGSDAVLVVEASEVTARGDSRNPTSGPPGDVYGELAVGSQAELASDPSRANQATVVGGGKSFIGRVTAGMGDLVYRASDAVPRRRPSAGSMAPRVSRRESQRRGAIAILAFLLVILVGGVAVAFFPRLQERPINQVTGAEQQYNDAKSKVEQALGSDNSPAIDAQDAISMLRVAWGELASAKAGGVEPSLVAGLQARVTQGLDILYDAHHARAIPVWRFTAGAQPVALEHGPTSDPDALYYIDASEGTVSRIDPTSQNPTPIVVVKTGNGPGEGIGQPRFLSVGGLDLLIVDSRGDLWSWRPSDSKGDGTLRNIRVAGEVLWGTSITDITTYPAASSEYAIYVTMPTQNQVLKYQQYADGSGLQPPERWLTTDRDDVSSWLDTTINYNFFAILAAAGSCETTCVGDSLLEFFNGNYQQQWKLATPPDDGDMRPGHDYRLVESSGDQTNGNLYLYDAKNQRVVVFDMNGSYVEQWEAGVGGPQMDGVTGMVVEDHSGGSSSARQVIDWITPQGLYRSPLTDIGSAPVPTATTTPSPAPTEAPDASPTKKPHKSPKPPKATP